MKKKYLIIISSVLFLSYAYHFILRAWLCDDMMQTMRAVLNFINGYGPVSNVHERVQPFTHPLWFLLLSFTYAITRNFFLTPYFLSITLSLLAFLLFLIYNRENLLSIIIGGVTLICSRAYIDFSNSGLEAPLFHLLIILLVISGENLKKCDEALSKKKLKIFFAISALLFITRQDLVLLVFPYIVYIAFRTVVKSKISFKETLKIFFIGMLPAILWETFSVYYYGFPFPATFYAKEFTGIPLKNYIINGCDYIKSFPLYDPFSAFMIVLSLVLYIYKKEFFPVSLGMIFYLIYIVYVGGDFMQGRFFTPILLFGILKFRYLKFNSFSITSLLCFVIVMLGGFNIYYFNKLDPYFSHKGYRSVADERGHHYHNQNLKNAICESKEKNSTIPWKFTGLTEVMTIGGGDSGGVWEGPNVYIIDDFSLNQALIARIPFNFTGYFRTGHVIRKLPTGYKESIMENKNLIQNKEIHDYYDHILRVTTGKLNSLDRFKSIFYVNFVKKSVSKDVLTAEDY